MWGAGYNNPAQQAAAREAASDAWINQNVPGGVNSPLGEQLDNMMGGNPNPTLGQVYGGAPGVGGFPGPGGVPGAGSFGNVGGGPYGNNTGGFGHHHHHHHHHGY